LTLLFALIAGVVAAGPSSNDGSTASAANTSGFYLDVGASASLGYQPDGVVKHNGRPTTTGYANDLVVLEAKRGTLLTLHQTGCPGETAESMLLGDDKCFSSSDQQLKQATTFLRSDASQRGLVSIDLGFNDVRACLVTGTINEVCAAQGIRLVQRDLPLVVKDLKEAAGPRVRFVGLEYGDPFLGHYVNGASGQVAASASLQVMTQLNAVLTNVYAKAGIPVANVPGAYLSSNTTPVTLKGSGVVPRNVAEACTLTWFCTGYPFGPDDHANNAGYLVIAHAMEAVIPAKW